MLTATVLAIFFVPLFFVGVQRLLPHAPGRPAARSEPGRMRRLIAIVAAASVLAGCIDLAPKYQRPANPAPARFPTGPAYAPPPAAEVAAGRLAGLLRRSEAQAGDRRGPGQQPRPADRSRYLRIPVLIQHGAEDAIADPDGSRRLERAVGSPDRTFIPYDGLGNEIYNEPEQQRPLGDLRDWLNSHRSLPGTEMI